jgi:hypothetical protein
MDTHFDRWVSEEIFAFLVPLRSATSKKSPPLEATDRHGAAARSFMSRSLGSDTLRHGPATDPTQFLSNVLSVQSFISLGHGESKPFTAALDEAVTLTGVTWRQYSHSSSL